MAGGYGRALAVMVVASFIVVAFFGGVAPGIQPLFDQIAANDAVTSSSTPVGSDIISDIQTIVFVLGPMLVVFAGILLPLIFAVRREATLR